MDKIEIRLSWKTHLLLCLAATGVLILEFSAFFGLPRIWYMVTNLVLVPVVLFASFRILARIADGKQHGPPGGPKDA